MDRRRALMWGGAIALIAVPLILVTVNMLGRYTGLTVERQTPEELLEQLRPSFEISQPVGEGPHKTALLFSGCDGPSDTVRRWARALGDAGWATIMVDSHTPRGFEEPQFWTLVCAGQLLTGGERAGDVAVALAYARDLDWVDRERLVVMGASHGGWSLMETLSMWDHEEVPLTLTRWPIGMPSPASEQVKAAFLLYPYCGPVTRASWQGWDSHIPVAFLLAENDLIANPEDCLDIAEREKERGLPVEAEVYDDVTHAFDHESTLELAPTEFDPEATERAMARMVAFLNASIAEE